MDHPWSPSGLTADAVVDELASRVAAAAFFGSGDGAARVFVGVAGSPGSGKSTLAAAVRDRVNAAAGAPVAVVLPMDGFHYPRAALADFPDPDEARRRRGAPWTFDADAFVAAVAEARANRDAVTRVPEFDHEVHDPEPGKIAIEPTHKIVLVEGNYLLLNDLPWRRLWDPDADGRAATTSEEEEGRLSSEEGEKGSREREDPGNDDGVNETGALLDETWFVDASLDVAMRRVSARHVAVGRTEAEAKERVDGNDRINGALVIGESRANADVLVPAHERTPEE